MNMAGLFSRPALKHVLALIALAMLLQTGSEFYALGWASGHWLGRFSLKWAAALAAYFLLASSLYALLILALYSPSRLQRWRERLLEARVSLQAARWLWIALVAFLPAYFIFWSAWGALFVSFSTRMLIFILSIVLIASLLTRKENQLVAFKPLLLSGLILGTIFALAESFALVSDYPFSLHWSEGNRIWDYSVLYGRERYNFPADQKLKAFIDPGRQALWGLPFLIPNISLWAVRFWSAFLVTVPYALLGFAAFRPLKSERWQWLLLGFWSMIFLNQGPIYTPLVLSAILVIAARRRPVWLALPLVFLAGHYAGISRFTWRFAPAIWAALLTLGDGMMQSGNLRWKDWLRAAVLGVAGMWTKGVPILLGIAQGLVVAVQQSATTASGATPTPQGTGSVETLQGLQDVATDQPYLWYRLLPNEAFPPGILLGLTLATVPLVLLLIYALRRDVWKTNRWQNLLTGLALSAFLIVGLIASAKVGGGTDLHNLDMFLISLVLLAALAWEAGLHRKLLDLIKVDSYVRGLLVLIIFLPAVQPVLTGRPPDILSDEQTALELQRIQARVACASPYGDILLMDQRQLLTFGFLGDLPLVPEYEKKLVMNKALSSDAGYFEDFRADLESGRFSLIISERIAVNFKYLDEDRLGDSLVEENNAWVRWVTTPLLDNYESVVDRPGPSIEIFLPIERDFDC